MEMRKLFVCEETSGHIENVIKVVFESDGDSNFGCSIGKRRLKAVVADD